MNSRSIYMVKHQSILQYQISLVIDDDDTHNDIHRKLKNILTIPVFDFTKLKYDNETSQ